MDHLRTSFYGPLKDALHVREIGSADPPAPSPLVIQIKPTGSSYVGIALTFSSPRWGTEGDSWARWNEAVGGGFRDLAVEEVYLHEGS